MKPLYDVNKQKQNLIKNYLLVTILSTGIAFVANYITGDADKLILFIGLLFVVFVAICYLKEFFGKSSNKIEIETLFIVDKENHPVPIARFDFSEDLSRAVKSVLSENKAYERIWKESFARTEDHMLRNTGFVIEFFEYLFIDWLSLRLNSYFSGVDNSEIEILGREQIPSVLIKNRVIDLISKPYNEREKFQKMTNSKKPDDNGEVYYLDGEDDVIYDKLEIELPRRSKVIRDGNSLVIKNRNFNIRFESVFEGFGAVMPYLFEHFYLNRSFDDTNRYMVKMKLSLQLKPFFYFSVRDWKYLGWLDQLESEFIKYFSFDAFVSRIGYEQAVTDHLLFMNGLKKKNEDSSHNKIKGIKIVKVDDEIAE